MSIFDGLFGSSTEIITTSSEKSNNRELPVLPDDEFIIDFDEFEPVTRRDKETRLDHLDPDSETAYAGEWGRYLMENQGGKESDKPTIWVGYNEGDAIEGPREVGIPFEDLFQHCAIFGSTGKGKSTLLKNIMIQLAKADHGVCFIDPKGHDSIEFLQCVPEERLDDVIWMEPSSQDWDKVVGVNFIECSRDYGEEGFETEVNKIISDVIPILRDEGHWGPLMDEVLKAFLRAMLYLDEKYTLVHLYRLLNNEDIREKFKEKVQAELPSEKELVDLIDKVSEMDEDDLGSARRRLNDWVLSPKMRQVLAHQDAKLNITDAVEDSKIIILNVSQLSDDNMKQLVSTALVRQLWASMQTINRDQTEEKTPFFLFIDEFDKVAHKEASFDSILSEGRSFRFGVTLCNQAPHQLDREITEDVFSQCNQLLAFNPEGAKDAQVIASQYDANKSRLLNLPSFMLATRLEFEGEKTPLFYTSTFAEYPPLRGEHEIEKQIKRSLEEHGVEPATRADENNDRIFEPKPENARKEEIDHLLEVDGTHIPEKEALKVIYEAQEETEGEEEWASEYDVYDEFRKQIDDSLSDTQISNVLEQLPDTNDEGGFVRKKLTSSDLKIRLTQNGIRKAFKQDTGTAASAGRAGHREIISLTKELFGKLGYSVDIPEQTGQEMPDGIAVPPINPADADSIRGIEEKQKKLKEEYPQLVNLFGYDELTLEAEKSGPSKPVQPIKNLRKSLENNRDCVFITSEGEDGLRENVEKLVRILRKPPYISNIKNKNNKTIKRYYNDSNLRIDGDERRWAVKKNKGNHNTIWKNDGDEIYLERPSENEKIVSFDSPEELYNANFQDFPYTHYFDFSRDIAIIENSEGKKVKEYTGTHEKTPKEEMWDDGWDMVKEPLIPEYEFNDAIESEVPNEERWHIIVIPTESENKKPRYYDKETDTLVEIEDIELEALSDDSESDTNNSEDDYKQSNLDEVPVKTTNEEDDNSSEKTKKPAEDDSNYKTGKNEDEYMEENFDGEQIREEERETGISEDDITLVEESKNPPTTEQENEKSENDTDDEYEWNNIEPDEIDEDTDDEDDWDGLESAEEGTGQDDESDTNEGEPQFTNSLADFVDPAKE